VSAAVAEQSAGRAALVLLSVAQALASAAAGVAITVASPTAAAIGGSDALAGWGQSATIAGAAGLSVPVARVAARHGRAVSLTMAFGVAAGGALLAAGAAACSVLVVFLLGLAAVGAGTVAALALRYAAVDVSPTPAGRVRFLGIVLACATVGSLVGPQLATATRAAGVAAAPYLVIAGLYGAAAGAAVAAGAVAASLRAGTAGMAAVRPKSIADVESLQEDDRDETAGASPPESDRTMIARAPLMAPILTMTAGQMAMVALMGMAPVHLDHDGAGATAVGWVMSAHLAAMYIASPLFAGVVRRAGAVRSGVAALVFATLACGVLILTRGDVFGFGAGLALLGLAWSLGMVASSSALAQVAGPDRLRAQGWGDLALNVGGGASSLLAGLAMSFVGYERLAVMVAAGLMVAALTVWGISSRRFSVVRRLQVRPHRPAHEDVTEAGSPGR